MSGTPSSLFSEATWFGLPAVEDGRRGYCHSAVALDRPTNDRGDLIDAQRDHARARKPAKPNVMRSHATAGDLTFAYRKAHTCWQHHAPLTGGMTSSPRMGITVYGCDPDEAAAFREIAPRFGVMPTITGAALSESNVELVRGNRCISVSPRRASQTPPWWR